jgi:hypothetical protein
MNEHYKKYGKCEACSFGFEKEDPDGNWHIDCTCPRSSNKATPIPVLNEEVKARIKILEDKLLKMKIKRGEK